MATEETPTKLEKKENVIVARNVGVFFEKGKLQDDYKSKLLGMFQRKAEKDKVQTVWPLEDINFNGLEGEILGIIGSNGAGKTTLSKIITGILQADRGTMSVDGKVTALFSFGMGFDKELSGRDNVYLNAMMLGIDKEKINHYFNEIHEFSDLGTFIDQPMKYYSSGMKARLGFSVAAHLEPEILILDEALNTGDAGFSRKAAKKMKELVSQAKMVIIVTHSLRYAQRNCDRLMWLDGGVIREEGDPKTIIENYRASVPPRPKRTRSLELEKTIADIGDETVIKADNIGVSYKMNKGIFWALRNVSFEIKEGEVLGIIGHNGAGKSTLCKVLTKILAPDEGALELYGETSSLLGYGTGFNAQLTGRDNIYLNAMLLGIPKARVDEHYEEIINFSGIRRAIDKPVKEYSSGMRSRLGFSIAAVLKPDIFIIDEALSTGDLAFRQKATERIQDMMDRAKAVIIVTHSMDFVKKVCTRALWIDQGQVRFDGDALEAVDHYQKAMGVNKPARKRKRKRVTNQKKKTANNEKKVTNKARPKRNKQSKQPTKR